MSFLYQALLKKERQNGETNAPQAAGMESMFAQESSSGAPSALWIAFALALLVIGVLAGYIIGSDKTQPREIHYVEKQSESMPAVSSQPVNEVSAPEQSLVSNQSSENTAASVAEPVPELPKQVNISVDENGQVQSDIVTASSAEEPELANAEEQSYLTASDQDLLDIDQVPDNLKESFELAVQATTEQFEAGEYQQAESSIVSNSSLPDIEELSDTDKAGIPDIFYQMHIFASDKTERWVKLNGRIMTEGEEFMPGLKLLEIRQDIIVWESRFNRFSQNALEDYPAL